MALTDIKVRTAKPTDKQYKLTDGSGMHLLVHPNGSKYWRLQYRFDGKQKMLALGVYPDVSLADARTRRDDARNLLANNIDPGDKKKSDKIEQEEARTFEQLAVEWHATNKKWSEEHSRRVLKSLEDNLFPEQARSSSSPEHLPPMPLHEFVLRVVCFYLRQRNALPLKIPKQPTDDPATVDRF